MQGEDRPCCRWLYSVSSSHCSCAVRVGSWLDIIPKTSTWLGSRGADRKRSSSKSDTRGAFTIHLQPARMSSLRMSLRSTRGQSEGEAAHLVGLRISLGFRLQRGAQWREPVGRPQPLPRQLWVPSRKKHTALPGPWAGPGLVPLTV